MRRAFFLIAISIALSVVSGIHLYLWSRLVSAPAWSPAVQAGLTAALLAMVGSIPIYFSAERLAPPRLKRWLVWPGAIWFGVMWLLLAGLAASDLLLALADGFGVLEVNVEVLRWRAIVLASLVTLATLLSFGPALRQPAVKREAFEIEGWPEGFDAFRIVQLSDLHLGAILKRRWAAELVERVNALEPDLVVITGDLVDGPVRTVGPDVAPLAGLRAPHGSFFVTGNHEMYSGPAAWLEYLQSLRIRVLANSRVTIADGDVAFELAGTHDRNGADFGMPEDLDAALEGYDGDRPLILLAHDPGSFVKASRRPVALQLSGHTHGGQIWPFSAMVWLAVRFVAGRFERDGSQLYVSRGTGFWGPPMRLGAPAEITEITLLRPPPPPDELDGLST